MLSQGSIYSISFAFASAIFALSFGLGTLRHDNNFFTLILLPSIFSSISWAATFLIIISNNVNEMHGVERKNLLRIGTDIMKERINEKIGIINHEKLEDDITKNILVKEARDCINKFLGD